MKTKIGVLFLIGSVLAGGYFYYRAQERGVQVSAPALPVVENDNPSNTVPVTVASDQIAQFTNTDFDFGFRYRIKPYGYSIFENTPEQNTQEGSAFGINLLRSEDYNALESARARGVAYDGPPAISVFVFDATGVSDVHNWLVRHTMITNCEEGTTLATVVAGRDAVSCLWDGLYSGVTVALLYDAKLYLFVGTRDETEVPGGHTYKKDFEDIVATFTVGGE